jgi:asparagine synthase (glutamine-hydrolysing)
MGVWGIAGKTYRDVARPVDPAILRRMMLWPEGQTGAGEPILLRPPAGFAAQGLSPYGKPAGAPAENEDGSMFIAFTGELCNRRDLAGQLAQLGHTLRAQNDADVALHGYEQWGPDVLLKLRGGFALAIYSMRDHSLFLATDRLCCKPLFWTRLKAGGPDETFLFASELKSFLAEPAFSREIDPMALSHYLTYQHVPQPWAIFRDAHKVAPASWLLFKDGNITTQRYWELQYEPKESLSEHDAVEQAIERIDESIRARLESDVVPGIFLSGGVDSSAMVAMMRHHVPGELRTFSIGFREEKFNELPYARQVAEQFHTHHEEFVVEPDALECLGELAWHYNEPMADMSAIPTFYVTRLARKHVTVAYLGDGGDESFLGYERYRGFRAFNRYCMIPRPLRVLADGPFALGSRLFSSSAKWELLSYVNHVTISGDAKLYAQTMVIFRDYQKRALLSPQYRAVLDQPGGDSEAHTMDLFNRHPGRELVERKAFSDINFYLPGALLPKVERAGCANSLICRAPLLDHNIMEWAARIPPELKMRDGVLKYVLKKAMTRHFTWHFLTRPKTGFGVPVGEWFRGDLREFTEGFLTGERARARGFFDMHYVRRILDQHLSRQQNHHHRIWALVMLEAWCRTFLDRPAPLAEGPIRLKG